MFNTPRHPLAAARQLACAAETRRLDLGEIAYRKAGQEMRRCFINVAGMGMDAAVIARLEGSRNSAILAAGLDTNAEVVAQLGRKGRHAAGRWAYLAALLATIFKYRPQPARLTIDGRASEGPTHSVFVCNGQYFGGGMRVAPEAEAGDGQFDVVILGDLRPVELLWHLPKIYRGTHASHPKVRICRGSQVVIEPRHLLGLQADGEWIGQGAATFRLLPGAIKMRG